MSEIQVKDMISALCREAERIEEDAMYSSKSHFNAEAAWEQRNNWLGIPATALAAIAGAASFNSYPEWAGILALLASLLAGLTVIARVDA
ncbi:MAG: SLATT domain-containing protein, partial [Azoarcus sp.]|nr:SLATT domain-containing protein [Azoarcus sp.]